MVSSILLLLLLTCSFHRIPKVILNHNSLHIEIPLKANHASTCIQLFTLIWRYHTWSHMCLCAMLTHNALCSTFLTKPFTQPCTNQGLACANMTGHQLKEYEAIPAGEKHDKQGRALRTQKQNDSKQIWVIIGVFPFPPLANFFLEDEPYGRIHCKFHFFQLCTETLSDSVQ